MGLPSIDIRAVVRRVYPDDPVTELLCSRPVPLNRKTVKVVVAAARSALVDEWLRPRMPPVGPRGAAIEITNRCNLRCTMCNLVKMERPGRLMTMDVFRRVIDRCAEAGVKTARLHTYGETLLHPGLEEMLTYAGEAGIETWISTNAQLLSPKRGRRLLAAGVSSVRYSVEGATRETYERIRVGGKWSKLLANVASFRELRDQLRPETRIGLNTVLMRDTIDEIRAVEEVFGPYVDEIVISPLEGLGTHGADLSSTQWLETVDTSRRKPCRLPWEILNVGVDGKVTLCCADVEAEAVVGDLMKQSVAEIWRGAGLEAVRRHHLRGEFEAVPLCSSCTFGVTNTARNRVRYTLLADSSRADRFQVR